MSAYQPFSARATLLLGAAEVGQDPRAECLQSLASD